MSENHHTTAYIGLGSNLNQPILQLKTAITSLQQIPKTRFISISHFYQTAPQDFIDQPDFVNAVACIKTQLLSRALLSALQEIENKQGRIRLAEKNGPRIIDLDLLLYGEQTIHETDLMIPHPRLEKRAFVLIPLIEIAPRLILPNGKHLQDCLSHLGDIKKIIRRID